MTLLSILCPDLKFREGGPGSGRYPAGTHDNVPSKAELGKMSSSEHFDAVQTHTSLAQAAKADGRHDLAARHEKIAQMHHSMRVAKDLDSKTKSVGWHIRADRSAIISDRAKYNANAKSLHSELRKRESNWFRNAADSILREAKAPAKDNPEGGITVDNWFNHAANKIAECMKMSSKKEADSASANVAVQRESDDQDINFISSRFREAEVIKEDATRFKVVLLREGLGNFADAFYYTRAALDSAVPIFNGAHIFADHPTATEEKDRPERSTRDLLGHFEEVMVETGDDEMAQLVGTVDILKSQDCDWARSRMIRAIENSEKFPGKDFVGLSINASGPSEKIMIRDFMKQAPPGARPKLQEAMNNGVDLVKVVRLIRRAVSCDLVTKAGAGGKVLNSL